MMRARQAEQETEPDEEGFLSALAVKEEEEDIES